MSNIDYQLQLSRLACKYIEHISSATTRFSSPLAKFDDGSQLLNPRAPLFDFQLDYLVERPRITHW